MADNKTKNKNNKVTDKNKNNKNVPDNKVTNKNKNSKNVPDNKVTDKNKNNKNALEVEKIEVGVLTNLSSEMKFLVIFITIMTFGIFWIYLEDKIEDQKELNKKENENIECEKPALRISSKIPFNVEDLISILGSEKNIKSVDASLNTLKIEFVDKNLIDQDSIKKIGAKGLIFSEEKISIIFGDYAIPLKEELLEILKINKLQPVSV